MLPPLLPLLPLLAPAALLLPLLLPAALGGSHAPHCPQFHTLSYNDPSGPLLMPDGTWHVFPINGNWGHCTSPDLLVWNCSLPGDCKPGCPLAGGCSCTGWNMSNTGGVSVTPAGYFAFQANNYNLSMAKATDDTLNVWQHNLTTCGSFPGDSQCFHGPAFGPGSTCPAGPCRPANASTPFQPCRTAVCGVVGNPRVPFPGTESFSDTGRALQLQSGLYLPVGARGPQNAGGGIHWFKASDETMTSLTETGFLFTVNVAPNGTSIGPLMECPDVFQLGGKTVVLGSLPGVPVNTEGTSHWWVGTLSSDDLKFTAEATGRFDWGLAGFSSLYAAKSGTSAHEPFTRRVLFGFGGWREPEMASCGGWYVLPRELTLSPEGTLLQHPAVEMKKLRKGAAISGPDQLAAGGQIEVLVRCPLPATPPSSGMLGVATLGTASHNQSVQVGYDFGTKTGFATVAAGLGLSGNTSRTDRTPILEHALRGDAIELNVFVDGQRVETFFGGETTITTSTGNMVATEQLSSSFVNTAKLPGCNVTSWALVLPGPPPP